MYIFHTRLSEFVCLAICKGNLGRHSMLLYSQHLKRRFGTRNWASTNSSGGGVLASSSNSANRSGVKRLIMYFIYFIGLNRRELLDDVCLTICGHL
jgi:hypothetical protein